MIQAYRLAKGSMNLSAHTFVVRHCFLRAPTPDTQMYADTMYRKFLNSTDTEKLSIIDYELEAYEHEYELSNEEVDIARHWNIPEPLSEDNIVDTFDGSTVTFESEAARALESCSVRSTDADSDSTVTPDVSKRTMHVEFSTDELAMLGAGPSDKLDKGSCKEEDTSRYSMANDTSFTLFREHRSDDSTEATSSIIIPDDVESLGYEDVNREL